MIKIWHEMFIGRTENCTAERSMRQHGQRPEGNSSSMQDPESSPFALCHSGSEGGVTTQSSPVSEDSVPVWADGGAVEQKDGTPWRWIPWTVPSLLIMGLALCLFGQSVAEGDALHCRSLCSSGRGPPPAIGRSDPDQLGSLGRLVLRSSSNLDPSFLLVPLKWVL
jgi:hypothetical protein